MITAKNLRWILLLLLYGMLIVVAIWGGALFRDYFQFSAGTDGARNVRYVLWFGVIVYIVLLAIPFVPGIEISVALLAAFGTEAALLIYPASIIALSLSYLLGKLVPLRSTASVFRYLGMTRAEEFVRQLEPLSRTQRLALLLESAPKRIVPTMIRHRYIALAVLLNLPGNAILGGGGGIALLAGVSGLFGFVPFVGLIAIAVLPIPLAGFLFGN